MNTRDRGERIQGIAESTSSASRLASSLAALFPGRDKCPVDPLQPDSTGGETRQFLPDMPERLSSKERRRRGQGGESQIGGEVAHLLVLPRPAKSLPNCSDLSGKT